MSGARIALVTDSHGLQALAADWRALWHRVPQATPFQAPEWLLPWWQAFGSPQPIIACLYQGERLDGLLPLYVLQDGEARKLLPIGIGLSDYCDALLAPDAPTAATHDLLAAALQAARAGGVALCDLVDVPQAAALAKLPAPPGWQGAWRPGVPCPVLAIPDGAQAAEDAVPARQRRKLRMNRHRAERAGGLRLHFADAAQAPGMMRLLLRLHGERWPLDPAAASFHRTAAPGLVASGLARLACLHIGGHPAACCYALADQARLMFYMIGFDPGCAAASPGSLLIGGMIDAALAEGCREVHFLRGDEAYKYAWGARDRHNLSCRMEAA